MSPPTKRRKITQLGVAEENDADLPTAHTLANAPSSTAWSMREIGRPHPLSLSTLCMRAFAHNIEKLSSDPDLWDYVREQLKLVPSILIPRLFDTLRSVCPNRLSHAFISAFLLRGDTIVLTNELPGVTKFTISAIGTHSTYENLVELQLKKLENISDDVIASVIRKIPSLTILNLRECVKVGTKTAEAAGATCSRLKVVNFGYTAVSPISLAPLLKQCQDLEVLKVAGISSWTDATVNKLLLELISVEGFQLQKLKALKLRQTSVSDSTVNTFLTLCPTLRRLDLSFTAVRHPPLLLSNTSLEKLSLTSTRVSSADLLKIVTGLESLKVLSIGALGRGESSVAGISNSTAMTMTDETLRKLTTHLLRCKDLESVNLVGNSKLGVVSRGALIEFIRQVGRQCTTLNLSSIPSLRSSDLEYLLPLDMPPSSLQTLILNNTGIDDNVAPFIASCKALQVLEVGGTKLTNGGLFTIIDSCTSLQQLNLTSCRGVDVAHRRRFFEVYAEDRRSQHS